MKSSIRIAVTSRELLTSSSSLVSSSFLRVCIGKSGLNGDNSTLPMFRCHAFACSTDFSTLRCRYGLDTQLSLQNEHQAGQDRATSRSPAPIRGSAYSSGASVSGAMLSRFFTVRDRNGIRIPSSSER